MGSAKHARLFAFKNTVGAMTADAFTMLTSQPKPRLLVPEPRLVFYSLGFGFITLKGFCLSKSHDSVAATYAEEKMVTVSRMITGQVIPTNPRGLTLTPLLTRHARRWSMRPSCF